MTIRGGISLVATLVLVLGLDLGIPGFLLGNLAGPAIVTLAMTPRLLLRQGIDLTGARARLGDVLRFGSPLVPSALGLWALTHLDAYLLRVFAGLSHVGTYNFAAELCLPIALLMNAIQLAWPSFAFNRAREVDGAAHIARVFRHLYVALVGGALAVALLRRESSAGVRHGHLSPLAPRDSLARAVHLSLRRRAVLRHGPAGGGADAPVPSADRARDRRECRAERDPDPALSRSGGGGGDRGDERRACRGDAGRGRSGNFAFRSRWAEAAAVLAAAAIVYGAGELVGEHGIVIGIAARLALLFGLYPAALAATRAVSFAELRALPRMLSEIARPPARGSAGA